MMMTAMMLMVAGGPSGIKWPSGNGCGARWIDTQLKPGWGRSMDALGTEPRALRARSGCDTTTPRARNARHEGRRSRRHAAAVAHALSTSSCRRPAGARGLRFGAGNSARGVKLASVSALVCTDVVASARYCAMDSLGLEPRTPRMLSGRDATTPRAQIFHFPAMLPYMSQHAAS